MRAALAGVLVAAVSVACSAQISPTPHAEFYFPRHGSPLGAGDAALLEGRVQAADGCLWVQGGDGTAFLVLWPADTSLGLVNGRPAVLGPRRELLVETGQEARLGGSATDRATAQQLVGPIPDRCSGASFWVVSQVLSRP